MPLPKPHNISKSENYFIKSIQIENVLAKNLIGKMSYLKN